MFAVFILSASGFRPDRLVQTNNLILGFIWLAARADRGNLVEK